MKIIIPILFLLISSNGYSFRGNNHAAPKFLCKIDNNNIKCSKKTNRYNQRNNDDALFSVVVKGKKIIIDHNNVNYFQLKDGTDIDITSVMEAVKQSGTGTHGGG